MCGTDCRDTSPPIHSPAGRGFSVFRIASMTMSFCARTGYNSQNHCYLKEDLMVSLPSSSVETSEYSSITKKLCDRINKISPNAGLKTYRFMRSHPLRRRARDEKGLGSMDGQFSCITRLRPPVGTRMKLEDLSDDVRSV